MNLRALVTAYFSYRAIQIYLGLGVAAGVTGLWWARSPLPWAAASLAAVLAYPLVWYLLHRYVLHGSFLYKMPWSAALWKRIHFDHHRDPHDLRVLFGSLANTLPTLMVVTMPLGWVIGGRAGAVAGLSAALFTTCIYEFCHCIQHLAYQPKSAFFRRIKRLHLAHHFHNETGNFGITNFFWDRLLGTFYGHVREVPRSVTVFNLGYSDQAAERWPYVARLTKDWGRGQRPLRSKIATHSELDDTLSTSPK